MKLKKIKKRQPNMKLKESRTQPTTLGDIRLVGWLRKKEIRERSLVQTPANKGN